ncbi:MAG: TIGR00289 family protein [Nanoarchaeota archaeon]|nr:TIGR00289 family protein [Nanoarchaeota archaeon]
MRLGALFSGGKDSCYAMHLAMKEHEIVCLISMLSSNKESFMFHTPNIEMTRMQAEAIDLPLISAMTLGKKEEELKDLKDAIKKAKDEFRIEGIVTGALASVYQASRIQKICDDLNLKCVNPLWQKDQVQLLNEVVDAGFEVIISGVFAEPLDDKWLGEKITKETIARLEKLKESHKINPAGEGGEIETTVLDAPFFKRRIKIKEATISYAKNAGVFMIEKALLVDK